ncbi:MAG: glucose-1-phosphate thymidylyltransferase [Bacteroidia bacterium]|nr:glucose-1-phosphate thymidylyltransferase [Bacteroidia bacterium]
MNFVLVDGPNRDHLLPLVATRAVADLRLGVLTIREKWEVMLQTKCDVLTQDYLSADKPATSSNIIYINASVIPSVDLVAVIKKLEAGNCIVNDERVIAFQHNELIECSDFENVAASLVKTEIKLNILSITYPWDLFSNNADAIGNDVEQLRSKRKFINADKSNNILNEKNVFIEDGATVMFCTINAEDGPVYIGKDAQVMEGSLIRGPVAICNNATVKMGAKIYGGTSIGPFCKIGGEVNNSIFMAYSNKGHDGFIGNSVIGEWCNLGADTNNSNLKNNYGNVRVWNEPAQDYIDTGLQFCGVFIADHSKCGINTMLNTGTVIGVSSNIFGGGFPPKNIPAYSWGGAAGFERFKFDKAIEVAIAMYKRRGMQFSDKERSILQFLFDNLQ